MIKKIVFAGLAISVLASTSFGLEIDGKVKSSFGIFLDKGHDNSWTSQKTASTTGWGSAPFKDAEIFKSTVGLTLKADDTKVYWESKFTADGTNIGLSAAYLYVDTELKALPGTSLRFGYQRLGIADAEIHPYADGSFYTFCKDKGTGVSVFFPVGDFDVKISQLGTMYLLDDNKTSDSTGKSFNGVLVKYAKDFSVGVIYSKDTSTSNSKSGMQIYGDYTNTTLLENLKLTATYFQDMTDEAAKAYITQASKARQDIGLYAVYTVLPELDLYANYLLDNNRIDINNKISYGVKYKLSSGVSCYLHSEKIENKTGKSEAYSTFAFETSI